MASSSARKVSSSKTATASPSPSPSPEVKKASTAKKGTAKTALEAVKQVYRRFSKDTSGTFRFEAIDPKTGAPLAQDDKQAHATQLYIRKSSKAMSSDPKFLIVTIQEVDKLPKGADNDEEDA